jgi:hypothetical protein
MWCYGRQASGLWQANMHYAVTRCRDNPHPLRG